MTIINVSNFRPIPWGWADFCCFDPTNWQVHLRGCTCIPGLTV